MKRTTPVLFLALFFAASLSAQTLVWTGTGVDVDGLPVGSGTGWQGEVTPAGTGSENIYLGASLNEEILLPSNFAVNKVTLDHDDDFHFDPGSGSATLTLLGGLAAGGSTNPGALFFGPNVTLNVPTAQTFDIGYNTAVISGAVTGSGDLTLKASGGTFIFNNTAPDNTNTGNITLDFDSVANRVVFWNNNPFGSGTVTFLHAGSLTAHGSQTLANNFVLNSAAGGSINLKSWDAPLTLSGGITLANNTTILVQSSLANVEAADRTGNLQVAGAQQRNPVYITGAIGESGGARTLTVGAAGVLILNPTTGPNTYTGGTTVNGSLVFGSNDAIPATGNVTVTTQGYAGLNNPTASDFFTQVSSHFSTASTGAIGIDSMPGKPTNTFAGDINLSNSGANALGFNNSSIRIGTATSAILTGGLTPTDNAGQYNYAFGNGGGTLYVRTSLSDTAGNGATHAGRGLTVGGISAPLKLFLQGTNTYTGTTLAGSNAGIVIFDGDGRITSSIPNTPSGLVAAGAGNQVGSSYVGYTDYAASVANSANPIDAPEFLSLFNKTNTWGVIGFDSHDANNSPVTISSPIDLTGFNDGVYLGTMTDATLSGPIKTSTVTNADQTANTLRFTAGNGGYLTLASDLADTGSGLDTTRKVVYGTPSYASSAFANGFIYLPGANSYAGGTTINAGIEGLTLEVGNSAAFGTGGITLAADTGGSVGLLATTGGVNITNDITFSGPSTTLDLLGGQSFTLSGIISGSGGIDLFRTMDSSPGAAALSGNNTNFSGYIGVQHGTLTLDNNHAAGSAELDFYDGSATVAFGSNAMAPVIHGISGDKGNLVLATGSALTIDTSDDTLDADFGGTISGSGASVTAYSSTGNNNTLYLHGHNTYSGGTFVTGHAVVGLGYSDSAGTGAITVTQGGLLINAGVTLTNPLVYNSGALGGLGTFAPTAVSGTGQTANTITFGTGQMVYPGVFTDSAHFAGTLGFQTNVAFASGGGYHVILQDATAPGEHSLLVSSGNLDLSLLGVSSFLIQVETIDSAGATNYTNAFALGQSYHIKIAEAAAITGTFNAADFTFDSTQFQAGLMPSTTFSLSSDGTSLYLDFTPVPEPST